MVLPVREALLAIEAVVNKDTIAHAAATRRLSAGTIIGSGTVSNDDPSRGTVCITERRALELMETGAPVTPFMRFGDRVRIKSVRDGSSVFGAIDQRLVNASVPVEW